MKLQAYLARHKHSPAAAQVKQKLKSLRRQAKQAKKAKRAARKAKRALKKAKRKARRIKKQLAREAKAAKAKVKAAKLKARARRLKKKLRRPTINKVYFKEAMEMLKNKVHNITKKIRDEDLPRDMAWKANPKEENPKPWVPHFISTVPGQKPDLRMPLPDASQDWKPHEPIFRNMSHVNHDASVNKVLQQANETKAEVQELLDVFPWPIPGFTMVPGA